MSFTSVNETGSTALPTLGDSPDKIKYKSFKSELGFRNHLKFLTDVFCRKKFLKIRHNFKGKMRENNILFEEEQNAMKLAQRLQEQNE